ncbi:synapsin-like isoform X1 [Lytechinus pictus]|uniref:synapsin-like isoform X1 n=1 Tax=Lytechinus pictus TaxID=7653 RepID=UPI0030BA0F03
MDIVTVEAIHTKDGKDFIIEVNDSSMSLMGENQEEDRKAIADLVIQKMHAVIIKNTIRPSSKLNLASEYAPTCMSIISTKASSSSLLSTSPAPSTSRSAPHSPSATSPQTTPFRASNNHTPNSVKSLGAPSTTSTSNATAGGSQASLSAKMTPTEDEDTFKNLKKTFASIFGDL